MTKLTDTQSILLSSASHRESGSLLPLPDTLTSAGAATQAIAGLIKRELVEERETAIAGAAHRNDGDLRYGVFVTAASMSAIGAGEGAGDQAAPSTPALDAMSAKPEGGTKSAAFTALLQCKEGATLPELIAATGWLPHTTRAALTGLRKKGHVIEKSKRDGATCYRIASNA